MFKLKQHAINDGLGNTFYVFERTKWGARRKFERETGKKYLWL